MTTPTPHSLTPLPPLTLTPPPCSYFNVNFMADTLTSSLTPPSHLLPLYSPLSLPLPSSHPSLLLQLLRRELRG